MGKLLILAGIILIASGVVITYWDKVPFLGKLPGDLKIQRGNFTLYFPLASSILISVLLSLILYWIRRTKS